MSLIIAIALSGLISPGQGSPAGDRAAAAGRMAVMKAEAARYGFRAVPDASDGAALHPEPLLRWNNPVAD